MSHATRCGDDGTGAVLDDDEEESSPTLLFVDNDALRDGGCWALLELGAAMNEVLAEIGRTLRSRSRSRGDAEGVLVEDVGVGVGAIRLDRRVEEPCGCWEDLWNDESSIDEAAAVLPP